MASRERAIYDVDARDKTGAAFKSAQGNMGKFAAAAKAAGGTVIAALGAAGAGGAILALARSTASSFDEVAKSANRLGTTVERLDALTFAAELNGAAAKDLETVYKRGARNISDAAVGIGEGARVFAQLGINARNTAGVIKSVDEILFEVADALPKVASETEKTAISMQLFGRSGQQLLPMLRAGSEGMREQIAEGRALSIRTTELARAGENAVDAELRWNRALRATRDTIAAKLLPTLSRTAELLAGRLMDSVTGLTSEFRTMIGLLSTQNDQDFFEEADQTFRNLNRSIRGARAEVDAMSAALEVSSQSLADLADEKRVAGSTNNDYATAVRNLADAERRLQSLMRQRDALGRAIDERKADHARRAKETDAAEAEAQRTKIRNAETELAKLDEAIAKANAARDDFAAAPIDWFENTDAIAGDLPADFDFDVSQFKAPETFRERWEEEIDTVEAYSTSVLGNAFAELVTEGRTAADYWSRAWKAAIADVARAMVAKGIARLLGTIFSAGGAPAAFSGVGALTSFGNNLAAPALAPGGGVTVNLSQSTLIPATTSDLARAGARVGAALGQLDRFAVER